MMTTPLARLLKPLLLAAVLALSVALLASACGGGGGGAGPEPVTFDISMRDNFFEPSEFAVSPGQQVTFNLTNDGQAIHNMRIAGLDDEYNSDDDAVSDPDLFEPGGAGTLVWTAPDQPGTINFRCDFHPAESVGTITVE